MATEYRVLILHASGGSGHVKAAEALAGSFRSRHPAVEVRNVNALDFATRTFRFIYEDGYNFISYHAVRIWGWLYHRYNAPERHGLLVTLTRRAMDRRLRQFLDDFRPDLVIGTHPLAIRLLGAHPWPTAATAVPTAMVVTDFGCHSYWVDPSISRYYVAVDDVRACLQGYRVPPHRVVVSGIPIDPKFARSFNRREIFARYHLKPETPTLLVVGGLVQEPYLRALLAALWQRQEVQCLIVAGRDHRLSRQISASPLRRNPAVRTFGFVTNLEELLAMADVAVTKAGGLTVSECLAAGVPLAVPKVIPGQEDDNLNFLTRHGVAVHADTPRAMSQAIASWLEHPARLARVKQRCRQLGKPQASATVIADVVSCLHQRKS